MKLSGGKIIEYRWISCYTFRFIPFTKGKDVFTLGNQNIGVAIIIAVFSAVIGAPMTGFFTETGRQIAIEKSQKEILRQLKDATEMVKKIESDKSLQSFVGEAEIKYGEKQLAEFYGPIYGATNLTGGIWKLYLAGKLTSVAPELNYFFNDQNNQFAEILKKNFHLLEGGSYSTVLSSLFNICYTL